jgi:colicin import membrane protein
MEALSAQQDHERKLAELAQDKGKKKLKIAVGSILAATLLFGGIATFVIIDNNKKAQAEKQLAEAERQRIQGELDQLSRDLKDKQKVEDELKEKLKTTQSDAERAVLKAQLEKAEADTRKAKGALSTSGPSKPGNDKPKPACNCAPGDPLCSRL